MELKPVNGWVFVKRDPPMEGIGDIVVGERARVGNPVGTVAFIEDGLCVDVGDRIHIPHYQVMDIEYSGEEYAVFKKERLFAKEVDGEWIPVNGYVKTLKCVNDHERDDEGKVILYRTDAHLEKTNYVEILDVANDCRHLDKRWIGDFFHAPESDDRLQRILYTKQYMVHEDLIAFTTR